MRADQRTTRSAETEAHSEQGSGACSNQGSAVQRQVLEQSSDAGAASGRTAALDWWELLTAEQFRAMAANGRFLPQLEQRQRVSEKKLNIDDFAGGNGESIETWLATVDNEVDRQRSLDGELWTSRQQFQGASARLKGKAADWFVNINTRLQPEDRTFEHLAKLLREAFGRNETKFEVHLSLTRRKQQPGERLHDFANSLRGIALGHDVPEAYLVEAFASGINNEDMAAFVRGHELKTLAEVVHFAVTVSGPFGVGYKINDWRIARQVYRYDEELNEHEEVMLASEQHAQDLDSLHAVSVAEVLERAVAMQGKMTIKEEVAVDEKGVVQMYTEAGLAKRRRRGRQRAARYLKQQKR